MATILEKWQITAEELTKIVDDNPSLRGFMFGYVSEYSRNPRKTSRVRLQRVLRTDSPTMTREQ